jgi:hypothetical protein
MPHLQLFAACERVQYDSVDNSASLIGVFQGYTITTSKNPIGKTPAEVMAVHTETEAALPMRWTVFSLWRKDKDRDEGKEFRQVCVFIRPNGKAQPLETIPFKMDRSFHRLTLTVHGFPVGEEGDCIVRVLLQTGEEEPVFVRDYPISVTHIEAE